MLAAVFAVVFVEVVRPGLPVGWTSSSQWSIAAQVVFYASLVNVGLCVFNLIPIPPLDGSVLFERLLPARYWPTYLKYRQLHDAGPAGSRAAELLPDPDGHTGPITWLFDTPLQLVGRRARRLSRSRQPDSPGGSNPMASAARA